MDHARRPTLFPIETQFTRGRLQVPVNCMITTSLLVTLTMASEFVTTVGTEIVNIAHPIKRLSVIKGKSWSMQEQRFSARV